jgi:very long chain acyl-CoA dehydrogenase
MNILNNGRFGMAAGMTGCMKTLLKQAVQHVSTRTQFGSLLDQYQIIQDKIARMALKVYVTESMAYMISGNMDRGVEEFQLEAAISKIYGSVSGLIAELAFYFCVNNCVCRKLLGVLLMNASKCMEGWVT